MALYRSKYPAHISPMENTYAPPSLPAHVSTELDTVIGAPSTEHLKEAQHAMRVAESLVISPLFDSDLNVQLPQHVFNLQFADSFDPTSDTAPGTGASQPLVTEPVHAECQSTIASEITQQGKVMNAIKETLNESKGVLENMNRVMIAIQRNQVTESGLPQLRFSYHKGSYWNHLNLTGLAGYLKFFGIGADLLEGGEYPRLKSGREQEARNLIFKHIGWFV
ncbi:unnamed protein product [Rhizoctonia solani]|uniref:Uncharacterized protein n=1 Tax=Rhizoctonia solani TaxID=456999 RepID=A0A8H3HCI4_9AGAM|nr:unnamed protein product [Rhizoctonia solani]